MGTILEERQRLLKSMGIEEVAGPGGATVTATTTPPTILDTIAAAQSALAKAMGTESAPAAGPAGIIGHPGNQGSSPTPMPDAYQGNPSYVFGMPGDGGAGAVGAPPSQESVDAAAAGNIARSHAQATAGGAVSTDVAKSGDTSAFDGMKKGPDDDDDDSDDDDDDDDMEKGGMPPWLKKKGDDDDDDDDKKDDKPKAKKKAKGDDAKKSLTANDIYAALKKAGGDDFVAALDASPALEALTDSMTKGIVYLSKQVARLAKAQEASDKLLKAQGDLILRQGQQLLVLGQAEETVLKSHSAIHDLLNKQPVRQPAPGVSLSTTLAKSIAGTGVAPTGLTGPLLAEALQKAVIDGKLDDNSYRTLAGKTATTPLNAVWDMIAPPVQDIVREFTGLKG